MCATIAVHTNYIIPRLSKFSGLVLGKEYDIWRCSRRLETGLLSIAIAAIWSVGTSAAAAPGLVAI